MSEEICLEKNDNPMGPLTEALTKLMMLLSILVVVILVATVLLIVCSALLWGIKTAVASVFLASILILVYELVLSVKRLSKA